MAEILKRGKALSVGPLKASQTLGAALAFLGFRRAIPMLHGAQGCTAFGKVFLVRHFREPIPLQTSAMDQISSVMGANDNLVEGLHTLCSKHRPALIGVPTTGLAETQGSDIQRALREFRALHPEHACIPVVALSTPDFSGCLESGFAAATRALIDALVPTDGTVPGRSPRQINVLVGASLTPGDLEELKAIIEAFGLRPVVLPDLSDSLDGHLTDQDFSPLTLGGTPVEALATLGNALATLVIGPSMHGAADLLRTRTGVPDHRFDHLMGLDAVDALVDRLHHLAQQAVPEGLERQRAQLQDAMLDTHFMLGLSRCAVAADPDLLHAWVEFLGGMGVATVAAVTSAQAPVLARVAVDQVKIGDLEDLEQRVRMAGGTDFLIGNAHAVETAQRLGVPILRAGFPQYDRVGGYQRTWIGYRGARQSLFDLANLLLDLERGEIAPYRSVYAQKSDFGEVSHAPDAATPRPRQSH